MLGRGALFEPSARKYWGEGLKQLPFQTEEDKDSVSCLVLASSVQAYFSTRVDCASACLYQGGRAKISL